MHSDPVCAQVSFPLLVLSAVPLLAGNVLRAALCFPSFLHSCEPPIIHGNLTSDTIFIQHNGLIKIGSGRKLLAEGWGESCRVVGQGGCGWAEEAAGSSGDPLCKAWSHLLFCLCPLLHDFLLLCFWIGADLQSGTGCSPMVSVPLPPLPALQSRPWVTLRPLRALGASHQ